MAAVTPEGQLELFDLAHQPAPRARPEHAGRFLLQLRDDQLVLSSIGGLLVLTVIFACGVERGKQLVRSERPVLAGQPPVSVPVRTRIAVKPSAPEQATSVAPASTKRETAEQVDAPAKKSAPPPALTPKVKKPSKLASGTAKPSGTRENTTARQAGKSRYAIQVVTFSRPNLAKQELDRLQARGERAFLVMRDGRTRVYVGPFPSKDNASQKLTSLRGRYQDCFLRTL